MGNVFTTPGGNGADLDVVTARAPDVYPGKVIVGADGEPITGTMPVQGGSTISPGTSNKMAVAAGRYVNGDVVLAGNANLTAGNIRRGASIFGVSGSWEGYVSPIVFVNASGLTSYSANGVTSMLYGGSASSSNGIGTGNGYVTVAVNRRYSTGPNTGLRWSGGVFNNAVIVSAYSYVSITFSVSIKLFNNTYLVSAGLSTNPRAFSQDGPNATGEYPCDGSDAPRTLTFNISNISGWQYLLLYAAGNYEANYVYTLKIIEIRFY